MRAARQSPVLKPLFLRNILLLAAWLCYYNAARDAQPCGTDDALLRLARRHDDPVRADPRREGAGLSLAGRRCRLPGRGRRLWHRGQGPHASLPVYLALQAAVFWAVATVLLRKTALHERTQVQMASSGFFLLFTAFAMPFV